MIIKINKTKDVGTDGFFIRSVNKYLDKKSNGTPRYKRKRTIRPSEIGGCIRKVVMDILNIISFDPIKPRIQRIFDNGDAVHSRYMKKYLKCMDCRPLLVEETAADGTTEWKECVEYRLTKPEYWLKGSPDALIHNAEDGLEYVFELKSIKQEQFNKLTKPHAEHIAQAYVYMLMTDIPRAVILYENKNTQELKEFVLIRNESTMRGIIEKIESVMKYVTEYEEKKLLPPKCKNKYCDGCRRA